MTGPRLLVCLPALLAASIAAADEPAANPPATQNIVFFGEARPLFLRLHIEVDGKDFEALWMDAIRKMHGSLDQDKDGRLSSAERRRGLWLLQLIEQATARGRAVAAPGQPTPANENISAAFPYADQVQTVDDLAAYLRSVFAPIQLETSGPASAIPEALFARLDRNGDNALTRDELEAAESSLRILDQDDDETIQLVEAQSYANPYYRQRNMQTQPAVDNVPFALLSAAESRAKIVGRLLTQYDRAEKDHKLSQVELGLDSAVFEQADGDGDGGLDSDELMHYLRTASTDIELRVKIRGRVSVDVNAGAPNSRELEQRLHMPGRGGVDLILDAEQIELNGSSQTRRVLNVQQIFRNQFRVADADNNKYLERQEVERNGVLNQYFDMMDGDGDGKLFESEMNDFIDREAEVSESRTVLTVVDEGRLMFTRLDTNHDGRLSVRELRGVASEVARWDRNGDGRVSVEEVPRRLRLGYVRGQSLLLSRFGFAPTVAFRPGAAVGAPRGAPVWFAKMDRNQDGDLSRREFLGALADFRRLDTDQNGLIDAAEAARAK